ncbi:uncharacterized protein TNCV_4434981 [Trichonephila clavipes]|nr:uncharacterized protein TNCV_4434981 [Trichonephila clavipes]
MSPLPTPSPDLSPIEKVWFMVAERLARHHTAVAMVDKLWHRVEAEWVSIPDPNAQDGQEVVERWANRVNQTINENAGEIGELLQKVDAQIKQITDLEGTIEQQRNEIADLQDEVRRLREVAGVQVEENILDRSPRSFTPPPILSRSDPGIIRTPDVLKRWEWYNAVRDSEDNSAISHLNIPAGTARTIVVGPPMQSTPPNPQHYRKWKMLFADMESPKLGSLPATPVMPREERLPRMGEYTFPGATRPGEVDSPNIFYAQGMSHLDPSLRDSDEYNALYKFIMKYESPKVDFDGPLESFVFERGTVPTALRIENNPETGFREISLVEDRGYYPGFLPPGAETWTEAQGDIRQGRSPPPAYFSGKRYPNRVIWPDYRQHFLQLLRSPRGTEVIGRPLLGTHAISPSGRAPLGTQVISPSGRAPLGTQVIGRAPLGTQVIGRAPLGTQVIGRAPLGTQVIGRAPLGTQVIGRAPLGTQVIERTPLETEVIGAPLGTQVIERTPLETEVIGRAPLGTQIIGRAPLGTQKEHPLETEVIGRAPLGTQVIERTPLETEVIGIAPLGTQVISPTGRARLGTQVIPPSGQETHPDISFYSSVLDSFPSTNRERISPELIIDDNPPLDLNRTIRLDDVFLPGDPLPQVPLPQVPLPQGLFSQDPLPQDPLPQDPLPQDPLPQDLPQGPLPQSPLPQQIVTPSRIPVIIPGSQDPLDPIERIFYRCKKRFESKIPSPARRRRR